MMSRFNRLTKPRFLLVYPLVVWLFFGVNTTERQFHLGILVIALGVLLRVWANGYVGHRKVNWTQKQRGDAKIGRLVTGGPYAFVRNPLYLGSFLIGAGFCVIVGNAWLAAAALGFFLVVYRFKMSREERLLLDECGEAYAAYLASVPRWLPIPWRRWAGPEGRWSWQGLWASKEWKTIIWITVTLIALYFREEIVQENNFLVANRWVKHVALLVLLSALIATDAIAELLLRLPKRAAPGEG